MPSPKTTRSRSDHTVTRQRERAADRRVTRHRQLALRREDAHPDVGARGLGGQDEGGFRERHLERDPLHEGRCEPGGIRKHRQLVARERASREDVVMEVSMTWHPSMLRLMLRRFDSAGARVTFS